MSKRERTLGLMRVAGYHDDQKTFLRLLVENRIAAPHCWAAFREGARLKVAGMPCTCYHCKKETQ